MSNLTVGTQGHRTKKGTPIPKDAAEKLSSFVQDLKSCHYQVVTTTKKIKLETLNQKGEAQFATANSYIVIAMPQWSAERLALLSGVIAEWDEREVRSFVPVFLDVAIVKDDKGREKPTTFVSFPSFDKGVSASTYPLRKTTDLLCTYNWATIKEGLTHAQKPRSE